MPPLSEDIARLARRARIDLGRAGDRGRPSARAGTAGADDAGVGGAAARRGRAERPQIASELFISVKTASVHVSNILGKLGVTSRGEAAATAHRLRLFDSFPAGDPES